MRVKVRPVGGQPPERFTLSACTLGELLSAVANHYGCVHADVQLSLNKKVILQGEDATLLKSLDICSGDALWLLSPSLGPAPPLPATSRAAVAVGSRTLAHSSGHQAKGAKSTERCTQDDDIDTADVETPKTTFMPHLLQQVWAAATQNPARDQQPLTLIVHAAMLESGFLPAVQNGIYGLPISEQSTRTTCSLSYALPERGGGAVLQHSTTLKCSALGRHLVIMGSVNDSPPHCATLSCLPTDKRRADDIPHVNVRCTWNTVKDSLAFPLLADAASLGLCDAPPRLLSLPTEVLEHIIGLLQARDLASLSGVCRQLRHMGGSDGLWESLVQRDFPHMVSPERRGDWKALYCAAVRDREQRSRDREMRLKHPCVQTHYQGNPFLPAPPPGFILGGDYDRLPYTQGAQGRFGGLVGINPSNRGFLGSVASPLTGHRRAAGPGPGYQGWT